MKWHSKIMKWHEVALSGVGTSLRWVKRKAEMSIIDILAENLGQEVPRCTTFLGVLREFCKDFRLKLPLLVTKTPNSFCFWGVLSKSTKMSFIDILPFQ